MQQSGDLVVVPPLGGQTQHLVFAFGELIQAVLVVGLWGRLPPIRGQKLVDYATNSGQAGSCSRTM